MLVIASISMTFNRGFDGVSSHTILMRNKNVIDSVFRTLSISTTYPCVWFDRCLEFRDIGHVNKSNFDSRSRNNLGEQTIGSAVDIVSRQNVIATRQQL